MCGFSGSNSNWVLICRYWSGVLIGGMVGFDGYLSMGFDGYWLGWWWVLHPLMWCCNEWRSNERRWFRQVCFILSLMVARCGWFWVCVGFVAWRRRWWLGVGDFGFVLGLWESSREEREGNNKKCKKNEYFIE